MSVTRRSTIETSSVILGEGDDSRLSVNLNSLAEQDIVDVTRHLSTGNSLEHLSFIQSQRQGHNRMLQMLLTDTDTSQLRVLDITRNGVTDSDMVAIQSALSKMVGLESLFLGGNELNYEGSMALGAALCEMGMLKSLYLDSNQIGDEGMKEIAQGLDHCSKLEFLDVSQNDIGDPGVADLVEALDHCTDLRLLKLSRNRLTEKGARSVGTLLATHAALDRLFLDGNRIGDEGVKELFGPLCNNRSLLTLDLSGNSIGNRGAKCIERHFRVTGKSCPLKCLRLNKNAITDDGVKSLVRVCKENDSRLQIRYIYLQSNPLEDAEACREKAADMDVNIYIGSRNFWKS
eukprot:113576_1